MRLNQNESRFIRRWTVANAVGFTLGNLLTLPVFYFVGFALSGGGSFSTSTSIQLFILVGSIIASPIGFCQKLALIGEVDDIWWTRASILGGVLWGCFMFGCFWIGNLKMSSDLILIFSYPTFGTIIGILQRFVLMKSLNKAPWWIFNNLTCWTVVGFLLVGFLSSSNLILILVMLPFLGAIIGLFTGIHLNWLFNNF